MRKYIVISILAAFILVMACKKPDQVIGTTTTSSLPANPFDTLHSQVKHPVKVPIDSSSIMGLQMFIFGTKCAQPACHDGSFEPDYRTVQSTYNTLVYHNSIKKSMNGHPFQYRVVPGDTASSLLYFRVSTRLDSLRMPLYSTPLSAAQVRNIAKWINEGAKDFFGNSPSLPNARPSFFGIYAFLPNNGNYRVDTIRGAIPVYPFAIPKNTKAEIWFGLYDDKTIPPLFTVNQVKFSTDNNNWSNAITQNLTVDTKYTLYPGFDGKNYPYFIHTTIDTKVFKAGDLVFMRVYVKDADHSNVTEIPAAGSVFQLQTYFSFYVR